MRRILIVLILWLALSALVFLLRFEKAVSVFAQCAAALSATAVCAIPIAYVAYRLIPKFLSRRHLGRLFIVFFSLAVLNAAMSIFSAGAIYRFFMVKPLFPASDAVKHLVAIYFLLSAFVMTVSGALRVLQERFGIEAQLRDAREEQVRTELAFLRAQVNPHFLFNILNTIYFQIHKLNPEARGSVEKLSEMLRYQLYECTSDQLPIDRELSFIRNYAAMQQLRLEPDTDLQIEIGRNLSGLRIAPLLLLPLVENAFKHISHFPNAADNMLHIVLNKGDDNWFCAEVANTYDPNHRAQHLLVAGGLGLQNVRRRLELLYPGAHEIRIEKSERIFRINLKILCND